MFTGTCSWADRGVVASDFYPRGTKTNPQARLQYYASVFPAVEIDASYHALQPPDRARQWLEWTTPSFRFAVKAFAWLTHHESDPRRLPPEIGGLLSAEARAGGPKETADVVGPICESGDFFAKDREMPRPEEGDLLALMSAGAYGLVIASNYNTRPRPVEVLVDGDRYTIVRRRETYEDLVAGETPL